MQNLVDVKIHLDRVLRIHRDDIEIITPVPSLRADGPRLREAAIIRAVWRVIEHSRGGDERGVVIINAHALKCNAAADWRRWIAGSGAAVLQRMQIAAVGIRAASRQVEESLPEGR